MAKLLDLIGQRFTRLVVLERAGQCIRGNTLWHCVCDCGTIATVRQYCLRAGTIKSCGCLRRETAQKTRPSGAGKAREWRRFSL